VQEKMVRVSQKCVVVCKPLTLGQVIQFEGGYAPAHAEATCRLRFHWQLKARAPPIGHQHLLQRLQLLPRALAGGIVVLGSG
jgi:hypothetical protein